jgi:hypothetical protein
MCHCLYLAAGWASLSFKLSSGVALLVRISVNIAFMVLYTFAVDVSNTITVFVLITNTLLNGLVSVNYRVCLHFVYIHRQVIAVLGIQPRKEKLTCLYGELCRGRDTEEFERHASESNKTLIRESDIMHFKVKRLTK